MKKQRSDAIKTRLRLLEAASEIFGKKGFWSATHEEISRKANANAAAINYHFDSKENLYVEAFKYSFQKSMEKHPPEGGTLPGDPPEKRMRGRILSYLQRIADPEIYVIDIMIKEMSNPTGLLIDVITSINGPVEHETRSIIKEVMGEGANVEKIGFCYMSIASLCLGPMLHSRTVYGDHPMPKPDFRPLDLGVEKLADYTVAFIMAGIRSLSE